MKILHVVGARPNFMKAAAVMRAFSRRGLTQSLVHTGQHYDGNMSDIFFQQLDLPTPDVNLGVGSGTHVAQTAEIMLRLEAVLTERSPDLVIVYGDVNSTVAGALVASKLRIPVAHVEAGLRSYDRSMPEEVNRVLTDSIADLLFTPSSDANENLLREGIDPTAIHLVGNVMVDTLVSLLPRATRPAGIPDRYALVTMHRPSNVDDLPWLTQMLITLRDISRHLPVLFPVHPRTRQKMASIGWDDTGDRPLRLLDPMPYLGFLRLQRYATLVITDSGGIQEETTFLGVPCLTVRDNTERPVTVSLGTNIVIGRDMGVLKREVNKIVLGHVKEGTSVPLWDGHAAERIADVIAGKTAIAASA